MELLAFILAVLFFLSRLGGSIKNNRRHEENQRKLGIDGQWAVKADNAFSNCLVILCVIVFVIVMVMTFGGLAVGG